MSTNIRPSKIRPSLTVPAELTRAVSLFTIKNSPVYAGADKKRGQVAQLVEQRTENPRVGGSIPSLATKKSKTADHCGLFIFDLKLLALLRRGSAGFVLGDLVFELECETNVIEALDHAPLSKRVDVEAR